MKKLLFNTLSRQIKEFEKTAKNTILALLNEIPNKTYQTDKIDEERIIITYDNEKFAFVGCYIDKTKGTFTYNLHDGLKLLGYKIINDDDMISEILYNKLYEIELFNIDNIQLLNVIKYINEIEFSED